MWNPKPSIFRNSTPPQRTERLINSLKNRRMHHRPISPILSTSLTQQPGKNAISIITHWSTPKTVLCITDPSHPYYPPPHINLKNNAISTTSKFIGELQKQANASQTPLTHTIHHSQINQANNAISITDSSKPLQSNSHTPARGITKSSSHHRPL